jgi:transposase-like protein
MFICQECRSYFAETHGTVIARLKTPLSQIINVLKARMEGMGLNAAVRVHGYSKKTILTMRSPVLMPALTPLWK